MPARSRTAPVLWRFGDNRELDGSQSSLVGFSGSKPKSGGGHPHSKTLPRVTEVRDIRKASNALKNC